MENYPWGISNVAIIGGSLDIPTPTTFVFSDGTSTTYDWQGKLTNQQLEDAGYKIPGTNDWVEGMMPVHVQFGNQLSSLGSTVMSFCSSLTSVTIPYSVLDIEDGVFGYCTSLLSVSLPYGVKSIKYNTFYGCDSLMGVSIPNSVTSIGKGAFADCESLTGINIPDSVTEIRNTAFSSCETISSILIPSSVTDIYNNAFLGCTSLTSLVFDGRKTSELSIMDNYSWGIEDTSIIRGTVSEGTDTVIVFGDGTPPLVLANEGEINKKFFADIGLWYRVPDTPYERNKWAWRHPITSAYIGEKIEILGTALFAGS